MELLDLLSEESNVRLSEKMFIDKYGLMEKNSKIFEGSRGAKHFTKDKNKGLLNCHIIIQLK